MDYLMNNIVPRVEELERETRRLKARPVINLEVEADNPQDLTDSIALVFTRFPATNIAVNAKLKVGG